MSDRDIRNFFKSEGSKTSTNKSNMIKQITLNPKKDIKKITKNTVAEKKPKKSKIKITEEEKEKEKKEFSTPIKKKVIEIKKNTNNIQLNKPKKSKKKKIILDDDEEISENLEIIEEDKEAGKIPKKKNLLEEKKIIEKEAYNIQAPVKKEEKLIPISVSDFFSTKKITLKTNKQIKEEKEKDKKEDKKEKEKKIGQIKEEKIEENKMEVEEDENVEKETKKIEIQNKENNEIKGDKKKGEKSIKITDKEKNNDLDIEGDIIEDIIMENENQNNKRLDVKESKIKVDEKKNISDKNINKEEKNPLNNEIKKRPIIKREIKKDTKIISNDININNKKYIKNTNENESSNKNILPISELWADKYIPKTINDIIGNQQQIRNLENWLDNWDDCILRGHKREENKSNKKYTKNENINARAVIISGPPGIGKTSSVRVLTKNKGYRAFELNASDKRNKDAINNSVGFLMNNTTLSSLDNSTNTKNIIIMDEVDGMAGNEDKGGIKALIDIVKKTKVPIIFICNDIYSPKLKSLLNYCYDIRFLKPDKRQIVLRLLDICKKEGIFIDNQTLGYIADNFGNDIRQIINYLDLCSRTKRNIKDLKKNCEEVKKDKSVTVSSFDICKILFNKSESSKLNFGQKLDLYFVDFDLMPNMMYENYIYTAKINTNSFDKSESLEKIIEGLDHISFSDNIDKKMMSNMEWGLLPDKGIHSTVIPSMVFSSFLGFPKFPENINKMSRISKINRELKELKKIFSNYNLFEIKNLVSPLFFNIIIDKLVNEGKNGIDEIVDIFVNYKMNANLFKENLYDLQSKENQNIYNKINNSVKTTLTKKLNERFKTSLKQHKTRTIMMPEIKVDKDGNILDDYDFDDVVEEEADEESSSFFEPIKKTNKKKKKN